MKKMSEIKDIMRSMAKYIEAINNPNLQPISHTPTSFDPKSPINQKKIEQIQNCRLIKDVVVDWLDEIQKIGGKYFVDLSKVHDDANTVTKELENEIVKWKNEEAEWVKREAQMRKVQKYGVMKFLSEKPVPGLGDNILYICQQNVEWRNFFVRQAYEESAK